MWKHPKLNFMKRRNEFKKLCMRGRENIYGLSVPTLPKKNFGNGELVGLGLKWASLVQKKICRGKEARAEG